MQNLTILRARRRLQRFALGCALVLSSAVVVAVPITGEELASSSSFSAPSTNALNYAQQAPGHVGQSVPYVLLNGISGSDITLDFFNIAPGVAFFEYRIDGVTVGTTSHPVVAGDVIHPGVFLNSGDTDQRTFSVSSMVEVRLALGGERDWDFDWTAFSIPTDVPEPTGLGLIGLGLLGMVARRRARG